MLNLASSIETDAVIYIETATFYFALGKQGQVSVKLLTSCVVMMLKC
jgi:hypothetical protein